MYWVEEVDLQSSYMMLLEEPLSICRIVFVVGSVVGMGERWGKGKTEFQVFLVVSGFSSVAKNALVKLTLRVSISKRVTSNRAKLPYVHAHFIQDFIFLFRC